MTVAEWWDRWWPTVTNLRTSTKARDSQHFRTHALPRFGTTQLGRFDRTTLRAWVADLGTADGANLAPATIHRVVQLLNKCVDAAYDDVCRRAGEQAVSLRDAAYEIAVAKVAEATLLRGTS
ncbi:hypothetical protein BH24ACT6_BH24ACT6_05720 [soil metagenome]